jgi:endonuclease/exonuclease/phosphatase family metal-dependent hydrolase
MTYYDTRDGRRSRRRRSRNRGYDSYDAMGTGAGFGSGSGSGGRRFSIPDWLMVVASLMVAAGFVLSWAARWINPETYGFMSAAGLFAPVIYAANLVCLLYWVIRWRRGAYIPLAVTVAGLCGVTLFFRPQLTQDHTDYSADRSLVSVVTYNVRGMLRPGAGSSLRSSMDDVVGVVDSLRPDILCLQEFASTPERPASRFEESLPLYNYSRKRYNIAGGSPNHGWGNAIYSKFPIAGSGHMDFEGTNNSILWADIAVRRDTVRVFNAHLQTTAIKASDERYIVDMEFAGDDNLSRVRGMVGRLTRNYIIRSAQADSLAARIAASPYPVVVCGDFNDTPVSWAYRRISRGLKDSFREAGRGYGHTYRGFFDLLRIDYMLHSPAMTCVWYSSPSFDNSDHNPVAVKMKMN